MEELQVLVYLEERGSQEGRQEVPYMRYQKGGPGPSFVVQKFVPCTDVQRKQRYSTMCRAPSGDTSV